MGRLIRELSPKQLRALTWWCAGSPDRERDAVICDGAVRSGKTLILGLSFVMWAMAEFSGGVFGLCGKTIVSLRRNVVTPILPLLREYGFHCAEIPSRNTLRVRQGGRENTFLYFGGRDEGSAALIQGVTLTGVLMDEAALMPRSFVEQALARCSVKGSKYWFNLNPEGPEHWFYKEWIRRAEERNALRLHFTMEDNPSLTPEIRRRYERLYSGTFYQRFILGQWAAAQGRIYDFFDESYVRPAPEGELEEYAVSCDYGTANPASFGLWGRRGEVWYRLREYYWDARARGSQKTDGEYVEELLRLAGGRRLTAAVVDPSALSFITALGRRGVPVTRGKNDVLEGIRLTAELLKRGRLVICPECRDTLREFALYVWDEGRGGDIPKKENDHAMDDIRYFAATVAAREETGFAATSVER